MMGMQRLLSRAVGKHGFLVLGEGQRQIFSDNQLKIDGSLFVEREEALHPNQIAGSYLPSLSRRPEMASRLLEQPVCDEAPDGPWLTSWLQQSGEGQLCS